MTVLYWRLLLGLATLNVSERQWLGAMRFSADVLADIARREAQS